MDVTTISVDDPRWEEFTSSVPEANPFHLPAWASVVADCYRFNAFVLAAQDTDGEIIAGLPTLAVGLPFGSPRWVSLPFTDRCPLLVRGDTSAGVVVEALRDYVMSGPAKGLEVRTDLPESDGLYPLQVGFNHTLALPPDPADLHPNKGHRSSRNQAIRKGVQVTHGTSEQEMDNFYRLHTLTRRRHGIPVQPRRLFDLIGERVLAKGNGFIATATLDGEVLASAVYLGHNGTLVAKYHASDPALPDRRAGYLIDWETMVTACNRGYHTLDMGRSDPDAAGLRLYKSSWGAVETPLVYTHLCSTPFKEGHSPNVGGFSQKVIRRSPPWVCRALGEVLYRWVA